MMATLIKHRPIIFVVLISFLVVNELALISNCLPIGGTQVNVTEVPKQMTCNDADDRCKCVEQCANIRLNCLPLMRPARPAIPMDQFDVWNYELYVCVERCFRKIQPKQELETVVPFTYVDPFKQKKSNTRTLYISLVRDDREIMENEFIATLMPYKLVEPFQTVFNNLCEIYHEDNKPGPIKLWRPEAESARFAVEYTHGMPAGCFIFSLVDNEDDLLLMMQRTIKCRLYMRCFIRMATQMVFDKDEASDQPAPPDQLAHYSCATAVFSQSNANLTTTTTASALATADVTTRWQ